MKRAFIRIDKRASTLIELLLNIYKRGRATADIGMARREESALSLYKKLSLGFGLFLSLGLGGFASNASAMAVMDDSELSYVTGQALLQMGKEYQAGGTIGGVTYDAMTFYKAGLDAELAINLNIDKLQLGCTSAAVGGQHCDIDIDQLSLSGQTWTNGRPDSSAILTRPFFEFAIKNDDSRTLREVVGIRMSAENAEGMLTAGYQDASTSEAASANGINSLSGYMKLGATSGTATTIPRSMSYADLGVPMTGRIYLDMTVLFIPIRGVSDFDSTEYDLALSSASANVTVPATVISGKRLTSANLLGSATIGAINFAGDMAAHVDSVLGTGIDLDLDKNVTGQIVGLGATVPIIQDLGYVHKILVNSAFSLSMQGANVLWPDSAAAAQAGWWMAFEDEIDIGGITPSAQVPLTNAVLLQALGTPGAAGGAQGSGGVQSCATPSVNCALYRQLSSGGRVYGVTCTSLGACLGGDLPVGTVNVPANLNFPLSNLKLSGQSVTPNCWGTARFC